MKHLYNKFVENFLFEQKFLNMKKNPGASPGARVEGAKAHPHMAPDEVVKPTIQDAKDRIARIRSIMMFDTKTSTSQKRALTRRLRKLQRRLDRTGNRHKDNEAKRHEVALKTYKRLKLVMDKYDIKPKKKLVTKEDLDARAARVKSKRKVLKNKAGPEPTTTIKVGIDVKELPANTPISEADIVDQNVATIDSYLKSFVDQNVKKSIPPYKTRQSDKYKDIKKSFKNARSDIKEIDKDRISIPSKYTNATKIAFAEFKKEKFRKPQNTKKLEQARNKRDKAVGERDDYVYQQKEKQYIKINVKLKVLAKKYNIDLAAYKPPKVKDVLGLIKKLRGLSSKIKDTGSRKILRGNLKAKEKLLVKIMNSKLSPQEKQRLIKKQHDDLKGYFVDFGLEKTPKISIEKRISGKIIIIKKYLKNQRGFAVHGLAMLNSKYKKGYLGLQKAKNAYEKALKIKNPLARKWAMSQIDKALDDSTEPIIANEKANTPKEDRLWIPMNFKHKKIRVFEDLEGVPTDKAVDHVIKYLEGVLVVVATIKATNPKQFEDKSIKETLKKITNQVKSARQEYKTIMKEPDLKKRKVKMEGLKVKVNKIVQDATLPVPIPPYKLTAAVEKLINATPEQIVDHKMKYIREVHKQYLIILKNKKYPKNSKKAREKDNFQKVTLASIISGFEKKYKAAQAEKNPQEREKKFKKLNADIDNMVVMINKEAKGKFEIKFPPMPGAKPGTTPKEKPVYLTGGARLKPNEIKGNYKDLILRLQKLESGRFKDRGKILERIARDGNTFKAGARTDQVSTHSLEDGYRIAAISWNKDYGHMVDRVIYRRGKVVCLRKKGVWYSHDEVPAFTRTANVIKSHSVVSDCTKRLAKVGDKDNETVRFKNTAELAAFKQSLIDWAKNGNMSKMSTTTHSPALTRGNVQVFYKRRGPGSGEFMIKIQTEGLGKRTIFFDTDTGKLGLATYKGVSGGKSELVGKGYEKGMVAMNKKEEAANLKRTNIERDKKRATEDRIKLEKNIGKKFKGSKFYKFKNETDGNEFTINADPKNTEHTKLLKGKIHELINFNKFGKKLVYLTIKGAKGKPERKAVFIPGQKGKRRTAHEIGKNGKLIRPLKKVSFYDGDTIKVHAKFPTETEIKALHLPNSVKRNYEKLKNKVTIGLVRHKVKEIERELKRLRGGASDKLARGNPKYRVAAEQLDLAKKELKGIEAEKDPKKKKQRMVVLNRKIDAQVAKSGGRVKIRPYKGKD